MEKDSLGPSANKVLLSNKVDEASMTVFLSMCKEAVGSQIINAILMTADTEVYYKTWTSLMGPLVWLAHRLCLEKEPAKNKR